MGIFSRTRDIFAANFTELLDRVEDPARMIRMIILEMEEQLGLDQIFGQRGAIHCHQRPRPARRQVVEALGNQLLASTAFADDQNRAVERCGTARPLDRVEKGEALADELIGPLHPPTCGGKSHQVARCFAYFSADF